MSPATWPVSPGLPIPRAEESETGSAFRLLPCGWTPGGELGEADGMIAGNRLDALPATDERARDAVEVRDGPERQRRLRRGPPADDLAGEADAAAVTATVSVADGGVHFTEVTMLAVAVSFTEVTEVVPDATGICA